ncbi:MAG: GGDEF domain-containing protein [Xanthobacteraceae bacterium]|nr:GGDEF domain-containing protein [Xanthobacteraceae bacterium]
MSSISPSFDQTFDQACPPELVEARYSTLMPVLLVAFGQILVGTVATTRTGDTAFAVLTLLSMVTTAARFLIIFAYRRRFRGGNGDAVEARRWQGWYQSGSYAAAALVGAMAFRCFTIGNAELAMLGTTIAFGYASGVVARGAIPPKWVFASITLVTAPLILGCLMHAPEPAYLCLAVLVSVFYIGSFEIIRSNYEATITQIRLKHQYEEMAKYDPLTRLRNRSALPEITHRIAGDERLAVHYLDLDRFKAANDRYGHPAGDMLLKEVANRLNALAAPADIVIRLGGDEFAVVQGNVASRAEVELFAARLVRTIGMPYAIGRDPIHLGASIGFAIAPGDGTTAEALLAQADSRLYASKRAHADVAYIALPPTLAPARDISLSSSIEIEPRV